MSLVVTAVSASLGGHSVLHDIDLTVEPGKLLALVGPNGAGKTTLLAIMAGDIAPTSGTVCIDGTDVRELRVAELARRRAVLPQEHRLAFGFRVVDVVRMGRTPWSRRPQEDLDDEIVADSLERADVSSFAERSYSTLSGGEKSRTSFARVLAQSTRIVLLDEPTAALDIRHQEAVLTEAHRLTRSGSAVVAVLHDLSLAAAYSDRICVLSEGRVGAVGMPRDVLRPELLEEVYQHAVDVIDHDGRVVVVPRRPTTALVSPYEREVSCDVVR